MSTWNSENTAHPQPREPDEREQNAQNGDDGRPAPPQAASALAPPRTPGATTASAPAPAGPAAEPQVVPTIAQDERHQLHRHRHLQNPGFLEMASRKPASHSRAHEPAHRGERHNEQAPNPGSVK